MKRFSTAALASLVLLVGGTAYATLCKDCKSLFMLPAQGTCTECGVTTASKSLKLCPTCSKKQGKCECCGKLLVSKAQVEKNATQQAEEQADEKASRFSKGNPFIGALAMTDAQRSGFSKWLGEQTAPPSLAQTGKYLEAHVDPARHALFKIFAEYGMPSLDQVLSGPVLLDDAADGCTVQVNPGQFVVIALPADNAAWQPTMMRGKGFVSYTRQTFNASGNAASGGADSVYVMIFKVTTAGTGMIQLRSDQPWNADEPVRQISYTIDANPADKPLAKLELSRPVFKLRPDLKGKSREDLTADPQPKPPVVNMSLKILNRSDTPFTLMRGSDTERITIELTGPGVVEVPAYVKMTKEARQGKPFTLKPGQWLDIPIKQLSHGLRGVSQNVYWTQPGRYKLKVTYQGIEPDAKDPFTLQALPAYLRVEE